MKALRTSGERQVDVLDLPVPKPEPGEVIVQMKSTGICGSDLHPYRHPTPLHLDPGFISGHEPCGVIAEIGAGRDRLAGRRAGRPVLPPDLRRVRLLPGRPPQRLRQPPGIVRAPGARRHPHRVHARRSALPDPAAGAPLVPGRRDPLLPGRHGVRAADPPRGERARRAGRLWAGTGRAALGDLREADGRHHRRD